ncbi:hypothetical protein LguiB_014332 [Lonicera macranthoides]
MAKVVVSLEVALALQERVDSFAFEDIFTENKDNPNFSLKNECIVNPQNDFQLQDQMDEIMHPDDARNEHPRAKPVKKTALTKIHAVDLECSVDLEDARIWTREKHESCR